MELMMAYKVDYDTLAIMEDGHIGNLSQGTGVIYTNTEIYEIPKLLDRHLKNKKQVGHIIQISRLKGDCI